ncbi:hypothetical protein VTO42DRAFT_6339 [Malbranchea cinnamomea]
MAWNLFASPSSAQGECEHRIRNLSSDCLNIIANFSRYSSTNDPAIARWFTQCAVRLRQWINSSRVMTRYSDDSLDHLISHCTELRQQILQQLIEIRYFSLGWISLIKDENINLTWHSGCCPRLRVTDTEFRDLKALLLNCAESVLLDNPDVDIDASSESESISDSDPNFVIRLSPRSLLELTRCGVRRALDGFIDKLEEFEPHISRARRRGKFVTLPSYEYFMPRADLMDLLRRFPRTRAFSDHLSRRLAELNRLRREFLVDKLDRHKQRALGEQYQPLFAVSLAEHFLLAFGDRIGTRIERHDLEDFASRWIYRTISTWGLPPTATITIRPPLGFEPGRPFECPFCLRAVELTGEEEWSKHLHADLSTYACTFEGCKEPPFETRDEWINHELEHRKRSICRFCGASIDGDWLNVMEHLLLTHPQFQVSAPQAVRMWGIVPSEIPIDECPFCDYGNDMQDGGFDDDVYVTTEEFFNHVAGHLEQLALQTLPAECFTSIPTRLDQDTYVLRPKLWTQELDAVAMNESDNRPERGRA